MISIYRLVNDIEIVCCYISEKSATYKEAIMGVLEVQIGIVAEAELDIQTGDYLKYNGVNYTLNRDDEFTQKSDVEWVYDLIFEHPLYTLLDKLITNPLTGASTFQLTGKLIDFVDIVVWNTNKTVANPLGIDTGWTRGSIVDTDYKNISFSSMSCRDVLTTLSTEFNVEFLLANKEINYVERIENATGLTFIQGKGNGLYEVTKQNVDKGDTITRIYPVGGNKNVPNANADEQGYLKLPELYLENTSEIKRIVEKRVVFEDIFPFFLGSITSVGGANSAEIICNDIDFNLTDIAVGSEARVNFLTGDLMGCSFEFQWNNTLKKLTLIEQKDETALADAAGNKPTVPSALKKAKAGDKFNFTGVIMPATYVNNAIAKLRLKATDWLSFYSRKRIKFDVQIDNRWMRGKTDLKAGDLVTIKIPQKNIESLLRIASLEKNLYTGKISATVSNYLDEKWEKKVEGALSSLQTTVQTGLAGVGNVDILQNYDARPASDNNVMSSLRSKSEFLSAKEPDTAAERITFQKGAVVRDLATPDFVQDKFAGAGAAIYEDEQGNTVIEADIMTVRKTAYFSEVQINQIRFQGGIMVYSAANLEVLSVADGGSYLQLNFDTKNGQITNQFVVDDQIRCQQLSGMTMIKYYMSRVTSIGADYIRISKTDIDGTLNASIGDQVVQFGNRTNTARQSLIEVNVVDGGKQTFYQGVNSYNLIDKNAIEIGRVYDNSEWKTMMRLYGDLFIGDRNLSSYFKYNSTTKQMELAAHVLFKSGETYKEVGAGIADAKSEAVQLAYNDATTKANTAKDTAISTAATDATNKANAAYLEAKNYADVVGADKQAQIDGQIISWFRQVDALLTNSPASEWTTETIRNQHANDTYTNTSNGKCWRFQYNGSTSAWEWGVIADTATQQALTAAGTATAIANGKRTVFDSQPTTPYLAADLWLNNGDLYKCTTARSSGSFVSGDWIKAVKYTDDTAVNNLVIGGRNLYQNGNFSNGLVGVGDVFSPGTIREVVTDSVFGHAFKFSAHTRFRGLVLGGIKAGDFVTISFWIKSTTPISGGIGFSGIGNDNASRVMMDNSFVPISSSWQRFTSTQKAINDEFDGETLYILSTQDDSNPLYITNIQFEIGNKATDYNPAKEDFEIKITEAKQAADNAQSTANAANSSVSSLNTYVDGSFKDGVISTSEAQAIEKYKNQVTKDFNDLVAGYNVIYSNSYLIGSAKTDLLNAKVTMSGAKDNLLASINNAIADGKTTVSEKADVDNKYSAWDSSYSSYKSKLELANKSIQSNLDSLANNAASTAQSNAINTASADATSKANAAQASATAVANAAQSTANSAVSAAATAISLIADMASDDIISPSEKPALLKEWLVIVTEKPLNLSQAYTFAIPTTAYSNAYDALNTFIGSNLNDVTTSWALGNGNGSVLRVRFNSYYTERTNLLNSIATKGKDLAIAAQSTVDNLQVGGRNLYRNGDYSNGLFNVGGSFGGGTIREVINDSRFGKALRVSSNIRLGQPIFAGIKQGELLTFSFYSKATTPVVITFVGVGYDSGNPIGIGLSLNKSFALSTSWNKCTYTWAASADQIDSQNFYFYLPDGDSNPIYFANVQLERGNRATDWKMAVEDDYVKNAIKGSASINGGLVLGNVMAVTDENGNVMAGMNGLAGAQYPIWSGAPNASNANFSVDRYGNLKAFSGQFGNFMIENGALVGYANNTEKVRLHTGVLPTLDSLVNANWVRCALEFNTSGVIGGVVNDFHNDLFVDTVYYTVTGYLSIPSNTNVKFHAQIIDTVSASPPDGIEISDFIQMVKVYNSGGSLVATNYLDGANVYLSAGTYLVKYTFQVGVNFIGQTSADIVVVSDSNAWMEYQGGITRLEMANDGFFMYYNATEYFYFKQGVGKFEKGFTDSPGVLATGSVASGSTHSNKWGAKKCLDTVYVTKGGTGIYYVPHLGGANYTVQLTCLADNVIARVTSRGTNTFTVTIRNMSGTLTDAAFDYTIYGAN